MTQRTRRRDDTGKRWKKNLGFLEKTIRGSAVPGPLVPWSSGSIGPLVAWAFGLLVFLVSWFSWSPGLLVLLVPWSLGLLVAWCLVSWSSGLLSSGCFSQLVVLFGSAAPLTHAPTSHHQQYFKTTTEEHRVEETIQ